MIHSPEALRAGRVFEPGLRLSMLATGIDGFDQIFPDVSRARGIDSEFPIDSGFRLMTPSRFFQDERLWRDDAGDARLQ